MHEPTPRGWFWFYSVMAVVAATNVIGFALLGKGWSWSTVSLLICTLWFAIYARPSRRVKE